MKAKLERILERHVPPGVNVGHELNWLFVGLIASLVWSFGFLYQYFNIRGTLFRWNGIKSVLIAGSVMPDFAEILINSLTGFIILAVCMLAIILFHYVYHYQGSKSIYLMKRLPNKWEFHRRCLCVPLLFTAICLLAACLVLHIYFGIYMAFTPKPCLTPHQWQKIWTVFTGVAL